MKNMKVSKKLITSFLIVIELTVIVGIVGMATLNQAQDDLYTTNLFAVESMGNLGELFGTERSDLRNIFLSNDDPDRVKKLVAGFNGHAESAANYFAAYEKTIDPNEDESAYFMAKDTYLGPFANMKKEVFALMEKHRRIGFGKLPLI